MSAVDFPPLSKLSAKFRRNSVEDWPVTRLAFDIFYGYRVISAYFLSRALVPKEPSHSDENFADEKDFLFLFPFLFWEYRGNIYRENFDAKVSLIDIMWDGVTRSIFA